MRFTVFETNSVGSEKYSGSETVEAETAQEAATVFRHQFHLAAQTSHLRVTAEGGKPQLIPVRSEDSPPGGEVRGGAIPPPQLLQGSSSEERCGWAAFCTVIGWINLVVGGIGLVLMMTGDRSERASGMVLLITGLAGGLGSFISGYIIRLLFDCRRYLRKLSER